MTQKIAICPVCEAVTYQGEACANCGRVVPISKDSSLAGYLRRGGKTGLKIYDVCSDVVGALLTILISF